MDCSSIRLLLVWWMFLFASLSSALTSATQKPLLERRLLNLHEEFTYRFIKYKASIYEHTKATKVSFDDIVKVLSITSDNLNSLSPLFVNALNSSSDPRNLQADLLREVN